jgi:hypothetical protein
MKAQNDIKKIPRLTFLRTLALATPLLPATTLLAETEPPPAGTEPVPDAGNLRAFVELARSDIRNGKGFVVAQNLPLTDAESMEFWPLQREYDEEFTKLLDERLEGIIQFANNYENMTNEQATALAKKSFDLEEKRTDLKRKYFKKFCKVIPPVKAARFFQIDNQLNMAIDLRVAASLPLIK